MDGQLKWYSCGKWSSFSLCLLNIISVISVILIVIQATAISIEELNTSKSGNFKDEDIKLMQKGWPILKTILIVSVVVAVCVHIFGLAAILKEHYHMVMAYAIIMAITTVISLMARFIVAPIFLFLFVVNKLVTISAFLFANEIRKRKRMDLANNMSVVCQTQPNVMLQPGYGQPVSAQGPVIQMETLEWPGSFSLPPPYDFNANVPQNFSTKA